MPHRPRDYKLDDDDGDDDDCNDDDGEGDDDDNDDDDDDANPSKEYTHTSHAEEERIKKVQRCICKKRL